jgi:magnesium transporter
MARRATLRARGCPGSLPGVGRNLARVSDVVEGLDASARSRLEALRGEGKFVWIDVSASETGPGDLRDALGLPEGALRALLAFGDRGPRTRKLFAGEGLVVFPSTCYLEAPGAVRDALDRLRAVEVHLLVGPDYVLTLHEDAFSLPARVAPYLLDERGGQHTVFAVVQATVATSFDALYDVELALDRLAERSTALRGGRVRMGTLRAISSRLSRMRRGAAPQRGLYERIGLELGRMEGRDTDDERYFDLLGGQVNRLVEGIDAAADALATVIDLRLNETIYLLTVVATIFLPLTFVTGFFGMNFKWLTDGIDTALAFWLLGIGLLVVGVALILGLIVRGSPLDVQGEGRPRGRGGRSRG